MKINFKINKKILFLTITNLLLMAFTLLSYYIKNEWQDPLIALAYLMCGFAFLSGIFANFTPSKYASVTILLSVLATAFLTYNNLAGII